MELYLHGKKQNKTKTILIYSLHANSGANRGRWYGDVHFTLAVLKHNCVTKQ